MTQDTADSRLVQVQVQGRFVPIYYKVQRDSPRRTSIFFLRLPLALPLPLYLSVSAIRRGLRSLLPLPLPFSAAIPSGVGWLNVTNASPQLGGIRSSTKLYWSLLRCITYKQSFYHSILS